jgi:hypothetical protein
MPPPPDEVPIELLIEEVPIELPVDECVPDVTPAGLLLPVESCVEHPALLGSSVHVVSGDESHAGAPIAAATPSATAEAKPAER